MFSSSSHSRGGAVTSCSPKLGHYCEKRLCFFLFFQAFFTSANMFVCELVTYPTEVKVLNYMCTVKYKTHPTVNTDALRNGLWHMDPWARTCKKPLTLHTYSQTERGTKQMTQPFAIAFHICVVISFSTIKKCQFTLNRASGLDAVIPWEPDPAPRRPSELFMHVVSCKHRVTYTSVHTDHAVVRAG